MFNALLPHETKTAQRESTYKKAFGDSLKHGRDVQEQTAPLWALAHSDRQSELNCRINDDEAKQILVRVYKAAYGKNELPSQYVPVWVAIQGRFPTLKLDSDPVTIAIQRLCKDNLHDQGFRLMCHMLIKGWRKLTRKQQTEVVERLVLLYKQEPKWFEWPYLAIDIVWRIGEPSFIEILQEMVRKDTPHVRDALFSVLVKWNLGDLHDEILNVAISWLELHGSQSNAGQILWALLLRPRDTGNRRGGIHTATITWISAHQDDPYAGRVLRRLLQAKGLSGQIIKNLGRDAFNYLEKRSPEISERHVLAKILRPGFLKNIAELNHKGINIGTWAVEKGILWIDSYAWDSGSRQIADQLLRYKELDDERWLSVASVCIARLSFEPWRNDTDYSFLSVLERRHLLSNPQQDILLISLRSWIKETLRRVRDDWQNSVWKVRKVAVILHCVF